MIAVAENPENATAVGEAIDQAARGPSVEVKPGEGVIRSDDCFHASSSLWSVAVVPYGFHYTRSDLVIAGFAATVDLRTSRV